MPNGERGAMNPKQHDFDEACRFIVKLGTAAHGYGSNAARLELFLSRLTTALGFHGVFRSTPTEIVFAFQQDEAGPQRTHLVARPGTGLELNRLSGRIYLHHHADGQETTWLGHPAPAFELTALN